MAGFDLDLRAVEEHIDTADEDETVEDGEGGSRVVLGILDGTTDPQEWIDEVDAGNVLVLDIEGELNELAAGFARQINDDGGHLVRFRGFLIVSPAQIVVDTDRL